MLYHLLIAFALSTPFSLGKQIQVNLQWSICDTNPQIVVQKLGEDSTHEPYKKTPVTYYDTNPPYHSRSGLMFRTKTRRDEELSAVKARFDPRTLDGLDTNFVGEEAHTRKTVPETPERFLCVWDRYGNDTAFTCQIQSIMVGRNVLWTDEQIRFAERCQDIIWENLVGFGPNPNPKWRMNVAGYRAVFDDVQAGSLHLMELQVKVLKPKANEAYEKITRYLRERGIQLCHKQEPRTLRLFQAMGYDGTYQNLVEQVEW